MRNVHIPFPSHQADDLRCAPATALAAVDPARIRPSDLRAAQRRFRRLRRHASPELRLADADAEALLAECDAVFLALDSSRVTTAELAIAVEDFRTFRTLVYVACSGAPAPTVCAQREAA